jgi:hypothetical protein
LKKIYHLGRHIGGILTSDIREDLSLCCTEVKEPTSRISERETSGTEKEYLDRERQRRYFVTATGNRLRVESNLVTEIVIGLLASTIACLMFLTSCPSQIPRGHVVLQWVFAYSRETVAMQSLNNYKESY